MSARAPFPRGLLAAALFALPLLAAAQLPPPPPEPAAAPVMPAKAGGPPVPPVLPKATEPAADPLAFAGWLRELAGACWQGADAAGRPADKQCYQLQFGRFLRGTREIPAPPGNPPLSGDSVFYAGARPGHIAILTWASNGTVGAGEALVDGEAIRFPQKAAPGQPETRVSWTRQRPDGFTVVRERREGDAWKEMARVAYRRIAK